VCEAAQLLSSRGTCTGQLTKPVWSKELKLQTSVRRNSFSSFHRTKIRCPSSGIEGQPTTLLASFPKLRVPPQLFSVHRKLSLQVYDGSRKLLAGSRWI
jgi:hypothetical protein